MLDCVKWAGLLWSSCWNLLWLCAWLFYFSAKFHSENYENSIYPHHRHHQDLIGQLTSRLSDLKLFVQTFRCDSSFQMFVCFVSETGESCPPLPIPQPPSQIGRQLASLGNNVWCTAKMKIARKGYNQCLLTTKGFLILIPSAVWRKFNTWWQYVLGCEEN